MSAATALKGALAIISAPNKWAKQGCALDGRGNEVKPLSDKAKRFDMVGALQRVECSSTDYGEAIRHLRNACNGQSSLDTDQIAAVLRISEADALEALTLQRSADLGIPDPYEHSFPATREVHRGRYGRVAYAGRE